MNEENQGTDSEKPTLDLCFHYPNKEIRVWIRGDQGSMGISVGGYVIFKLVEEWFNLANQQDGLHEKS